MCTGVITSAEATDDVLYLMEKKLQEFEADDREKHLHDISELRLRILEYRFQKGYSASAFQEHFKRIGGNND